VKIFMFGEPISKPPSVSYWRSRNQADVYLRRVGFKQILLNLSELLLFRYIVFICEFRTHMP